MSVKKGIFAFLAGLGAICAMVGFSLFGWAIFTHAVNASQPSPIDILRGQCLSGNQTACHEYPAAKDSPEMNAPPEGSSEYLSGFAGGFALSILGVIIFIVAVEEGDGKS